MSIEGPGFTTSFETTGRGTADPSVLAAINQETDSANWSEERTRISCPSSGEVMSPAEFKAHIADRDASMAIKPEATPQTVHGQAVKRNVIPVGFTAIAAASQFNPDRFAYMQI